MTNRQIGQIAAVSASGLTATVNPKDNYVFRQLQPFVTRPPEILVEAENPIGAQWGFCGISFETRAAL